MYDTSQEYNQKLSGCVVLFQDTPCNIIEAHGTGKDIKLLTKNLRTGKKDEISAEEKGWDYKTVGSRLGYTNVDYGHESYRQALYLTRAAIRNSSNAQGLSHRNVKYDALKSVPKFGLGTHKPSWGDLIGKSYFLDTLERKYPSYDDVYKLMSKDGDVTSRAFNSKFAVFRPDVGPFYLEYRGRSIGYSDDMYRWKIGGDFDYLRETLEYINLKVA